MIPNSFSKRKFRKNILMNKDEIFKLEEDIISKYRKHNVKNIPTAIPAYKSTNVITASPVKYKTASAPLLEETENDMFFNNCLLETQLNIERKEKEILERKVDGYKFLINKSGEIFENSRIVWDKCIENSMINNDDIPNIKDIYNKTKEEYNKKDIKIYSKIEKLD